MAELQELDRDEMWQAKVGNEQDPEAALPQASDPAPSPTPAPGSPPHDELLSTFEELLAGETGPQPAGSVPGDTEAAHYKAVRIGESPVDLSPLPALARPREAELRDLTSGRRDVERRIDLHGKTVAESLLLLQAELGHAREMGLHYLLVITGRGLRSESGARLRPAVQQFLARDGREHVLWFDSAPPRLGGNGAFLVRVRRPGDRKA
jgi:hypothetical protein